MLLSDLNAMGNHIADQNEQDDELDGKEAPFRNKFKDAPVYAQDNGPLRHKYITNDQSRAGQKASDDIYDDESDYLSRAERPFLPAYVLIGRLDHFVLRIGGFAREAPRDSWLRPKPVINGLLCLI